MDKKNDPLTAPTSASRTRKSTPTFTLYTDGASKGNPGHAGVGAVILKNGKPFWEGKKYIGQTTNNTAEYRALILGLSFLVEQGLAGPLKIFSDSQLMVRQLNGAYKIKQAHLKKLAEEVHRLLYSFPSHEIIHVPRKQNSKADGLANEAVKVFLAGKDN